MRRTRKYKIFTKTRYPFIQTPLKILEFKKSKWKRCKDKLNFLLKKNLYRKNSRKRKFFIKNKSFIKEQILKKKKLSKKKDFFIKQKQKTIKGILTDFSRLRVSYLTERKWRKYKFSYKNDLLLRKLLHQMHDYSVGYKYIKKITLSKPHSYFFSSEVFSKFLVKLEYRLDILLKDVFFFSTIFEAKKFIKSGYVLVNGKKSNPNLFLKKGDIISLNGNHDSIFFDKKIKEKRIMSFIEIDYYTKNIVIIKSLKYLTFKDFALLFIHKNDVYKIYRAFLKF